MAGATMTPQELYGEYTSILSIWDNQVCKPIESGNEPEPGVVRDLDQQFKAFRGKLQQLQSAVH